jgi:tripartite-type tricarboxylate transporter receptor subunit TctC
MKKILLVVGILLSFSAWSAEKIIIYFNANASQPNVASYLKMLEIANKAQDKYEFILEFKPGANGTLAIKAMDSNPQNKLATIAPAFVENAKQGLINESDYVPITAQGDACWALITNGVGNTKKGLESLKGIKELTVGVTGFGNATHLTAIMLGERYGFKVRAIVYKANKDALLSMVAKERVDMTVERIFSYKEFKDRAPWLQVLAINCPKRHPLMPEVKTTAEQGFTTPMVFIATIANVNMPADKRQEMSKILDDAQKKLGAQYLIDTADLTAPMFAKPPVTTEDFFNTRVLQLKYLTHKYQRQIDESR